MQSQDDVAASVIPVRMRGAVVALESSFRDGVKREVLRSLCQASTSPFHLKYAGNLKKCANSPTLICFSTHFIVHRGILGAVVDLHHCISAPGCCDAFWDELLVAGAFYPRSMLYST